MRIVCARILSRCGGRQDNTAIVLCRTGSSLGSQKYVFALVAWLDLPVSSHIITFPRCQKSAPEFIASVPHEKGNNRQRLHGERSKEHEIILRPRGLPTLEKHFWQGAIVLELQDLCVSYGHGKVFRFR